MSIAEAMDSTPHLRGTWQRGLQALRPKDKPHISAADTRRITGSAYVDEALKRVREHAEAHRWDFGIGYRHTNRRNEVLYWVEIHTANDHGLTLVLEKLRWLRGWLASDGRLLACFEREFVWVSSGKTSFMPTSAQAKQFALLGLKHRGRVLRIPDERPDELPTVAQARGKT